LTYSEDKAIFVTVSQTLKAFAMTTVTFDTHKFIRTLKAAGVPEVQGEAFSEAFKDAQNEAELASKSDIPTVRRDIDDVRGVAIFAKDFSGRPARKISKNYATANASGGPDSSCGTRSDPTRGLNFVPQ
jgi:hypothetical protein